MISVFKSLKILSKVQFWSCKTIIQHFRSANMTKKTKTTVRIYSRRSEKLMMKNIDKVIFVDDLIAYTFVGVSHFR